MSETEAELRAEVAEQGENGKPLNEINRLPPGDREFWLGVLEDHVAVGAAIVCLEDELVTLEEFAVLVKEAIKWRAGE